MNNGIELKHVIVFLILMQNGKGVISKSPEYIKEKLRAVILSENPETLLDVNNLYKFREYCNKWLTEKNDSKKEI